jgi:hypothetical protein
VGVTSAGNDTGITFTVVGTDRYGNAISETFAGANASVASGAKNFATVTSITPSGNTAGNVTAGTVAVCESAWWQAPRHEAPANISIGGDVQSGTPTWGIQYTFADVQAQGFIESDARAVDHSTITGKTADFDGTMAAAVTALRAELSGAGTLEITYLWAGR